MKSKTAKFDLAAEQVAMKARWAVKKHAARHGEPSAVGRSLLVRLVRTRAISGEMT